MTKCPCCPTGRVLKVTELQNNTFCGGTINYFELIID